MDEDGLSVLSFSSRCNSALASFTFSIKAGQADLLVLDDTFCDQSWNRYVVDLSPLSGITEFRLVVEKEQNLGAEIFIDDLVLFVSDCPNDLSCATLETQANECVVSSMEEGSCLLDWECYADGDVSSDTECGKCDYLKSQSEWTSDHGLCDDGNPATDDICDVKDGCFHF